MPNVLSKALPDPNRAVIIDGKKFLWDGQTFATHEEASRQAEAYRNDNFEVSLVEQEGEHLVYTRRIVKEVVAAS